MGITAHGVKEASNMLLAVILSAVNFMKLRYIIFGRYNLAATSTGYGKMLRLLLS